MSNRENFYFAQLTDIHIGTIVTPEAARLNLQWALNELHSFPVRPKMILCTGDCVCNGSRVELEEFKRIMETSDIPYAALPANHDLWGEKDTSVWEELIGPTMKSAVAENFKFLLWNDIKRIDGKWTNELTAEEEAWLTAELEDAKKRNLNVVAGVHNPPDFRKNFASAFTRWSEESSERLLKLLTRYGVKALISGDYHISDCWEVEGLLNINTASLCGFIWNGMDNFPVKPGYRIFHWDGEKLRSFWREGSYWTLPPTDTPETKTCISFPTPTYREHDGKLWGVQFYEKAQVSLSSIGGVWTGGPRPMVRPMHIFSKTTLHADTYSPHLEIEGVSWSINDKDWHPMHKVWNGLWDEWEAEFDPLEFCKGEYLCRVRAEIKGGCDAKFIDVVPLVVAPRYAVRDSGAVMAAPPQAHLTLRIPFD